MNSDEIARLNARYDERLARFGYSPETLGWTKPKHRLRYHVLLDYWMPAAAAPISLLDFGCGFGDLYGFARDEGLDVEYHGLDLNSNLIEVARRTYPEASFSVADPLNDGLDREYDVIVASGAHNHLLADNAGYIERTFTLFGRHARRGFAINFLSDRVNFRGGQSYHAKPEAILELAFRHSRRVLLRHDYMPFEFTIFVDKADTFSEDLTVFHGYEAWCSSRPERSGAL